MATPISPNTSTTDSGIATVSVEGDSQHAPPCGEGSAAALLEQGGHENEVATPEEFMNLSPAVPGDDYPPNSEAFSPSLVSTPGAGSGSGLEQTPPMGEMVTPEEAVNPAGADSMVSFGQGRSRFDIEIELAEKKSAIDSLEKELQSSTVKHSIQEQDLQVVREELEATVVEKNGKIRELKEKVEQYKVCASEWEKKNYEEKVKCESKIEGFEEKLRKEKEESVRMKKEFGQKDEESTRELELCRMKIEALLLECELARAELAKVKKEQEPTSDADMAAEHSDSMCY